MCLFELCFGEWVEFVGIDCYINSMFYVNFSLFLYLVVLFFDVF